MDTEKADRRIWLVKVPPRVAKRWKEACNSDAPIDPEAPDTVLGTIVIKTAEGDTPSELTLHLPGDASDGPAAYKMVSPPQQQHCLGISFASVDAQGRAVDARVDGVVGKRFDMVPIITPQAGPGRGGGALLDARYRSLNRQRTADAANRGRSMQVIDDPRGATKMSNLGPLWSKDKKRNAAPAAEVREAKRRVRLERNELEAALFELFGRQPHWNFTQLQKETDQPAGWLKEVLNDMAFQNKRGPNKDLWELQKHLKLGGAGGAGAGGGEAVEGEAAHPMQE